METLNARSARIDVEYIQRLVILHLQYMRVPADEQLWGTHQNAALDGRVVVAGITADMLHQHLRPIHRETENLRIELPYHLPVNFAIHGTEGTESRQLLCHFQRTDVTGMPYFVTALKILQVLFIPVAMRIR